MGNKLEQNLEVKDDKRKVADDSVDRKRLSGHVAKVHVGKNKGKKKFMCSKCDEGFNSEIQLLTHTAFVHEDWGTQGDGVSFEP